MRLVKSWCAVLLLIGLLPSSAHGQDGARSAAVASVSAGDSVRLEASGLGRVEGRFIMANSMSLTLGTTSDGPMQVALDDVEGLWVRERATRKGALIGSVGGAVLGVVGGLLISGIACEPSDGGDCTAAEVAAVTGLLGGVGGAAIGAGVGYAIPVWRLRFP